MRTTPSPSAGSKNSAYSGKKRGRRKTPTPVKSIKKQSRNKNFRMSHTTISVTKQTKEKLELFRKRQAPGMSIDAAIQELLKFYPDVGSPRTLRPERKHSVSLQGESSEEENPPATNTNMMRMSIIGRLVSEVGVSQLKVPLCLALCDLYFHGKVDVS
jgi:hypothetical protein